LLTVRARASPTSGSNGRALAPAGGVLLEPKGQGNAKSQSKQQKKRAAEVGWREPTGRSEGDWAKVHC
jgi:hypothetical protein